MGSRFGLASGDEDGLLAGLGEAFEDESEGFRIVGGVRGLGVDLACGHGVFLGSRGRAARAAGAPIRAGGLFGSKARRAQDSAGGDVDAVAGVEVVELAERDATARDGRVFIACDDGEDRGETEAGNASEDEFVGGVLLPGVPDRRRGSSR